MSVSTYVSPHGRSTVKGMEEVKKIRNYNEIHRLLMNFDPSPGLSYMSRQAGSLQMSQT